MTLQEAVAIVQTQFGREVNPGDADAAAIAESRAAYDAALESHPCVMAVAVQVWGDEITRQNMARAMAAQKQAQAQAQAQQGGNPGAPGSNFMK